MSIIKETKVQTEQRQYKEGVQVIDTIQFFRNERMNANGMYIETILDFDDVFREEVHDYVQWIFPIDSVSANEPRAPIVNNMMIYAFMTIDKLKEMQIKAFIFMLDHFGLVYEADEIEKGPAFQECKHRLAHDNHNLVRITRILRSLYLLDQKCLAKKFFSFLSELRLNDIFIMDVTYYHWANAVMDVDGCSYD